MEIVTVVKTRQNFSELMARVAYTGQRVVVERKGRPMMALISMEDMRRLQGCDEGAGELRARREAALGAATAARAAIRAERSGLPLPDSGETLARLREEGADEPADLR